MYNNDHIMYYYREIDELAKARQLFIERFPKLAPFLSNTSKDPDIERLIENFAILTSKIKNGVRPKHTIYCRIINKYYRTKLYIIYTIYVYAGI